MGTPFVVVWNPGAGNRDWSSLVPVVAKGLRVDGIPPLVIEATGGRLSAAVDEALSGPCRAVVAAGGDGTVGTVARALADSDIPLGILPLGTFNHFARDAGVPGHLHQALAAIRHGHPRPVDGAEVNGRFFVNNASLGIYPAAVGRRERHRARGGRGRSAIFVLSLLETFVRLPRLRVTLVSHGVRRDLETSFVLVGNNEYSLERPGLGRRRRLDAGRLGICHPTEAGRGALLRLGVGTLFGTSPAGLESQAAIEAGIDADEELLPVATDGEVELLRPPLLFRSRPSALRILLPGKP